MSIKESLWYHLTNDAGVSALVSTRLYPAGEAPASAARPFLTYQKISNVHERHMIGGDGLTHPTFQIDCWADSAAAADALADAVRQALDNWAGNMGEAGNQVDVSAAFLRNDLDGFVPPTDASEVGVHRVTLDFEIWHAESVTARP